MLEYVQILCIVVVLGSAETTKWLYKPSFKFLLSFFYEQVSKHGMLQIVKSLRTHENPSFKSLVHSEIVKPIMVIQSWKENVVLIYYKNN